MLNEYDYDSELSKERRYNRYVSKPSEIEKLLLTMFFTSLATIKLI